MQRKLLVYGSMFIISLLTQKLKQVNAEAMEYVEDPFTEPTTSKIKTMNDKPNTAKPNATKPNPAKRSYSNAAGLNFFAGVVLSASAVVYKIRGNTPKPVIVFIHGFNNSKDDIEKRRQFIARETQLDVKAYPWESKGDPFKYKEDQKTVELHVDRLCKYFKNLIEKGVKELYVIAHSMGNYLLSLFLQKMVDKELENDFDFKKFTKVEIISVAADVDCTFMNDLVKHLMSNQYPPLYGITKWTHYYNNKDKALITSEKCQNRTWCGSAGRYKLDNLLSNVISVDCSNLGGHSYIDDPRFICDIKQLMEGQDEKNRNTLKTIEYSERSFEIKN